MAKSESYKVENGKQITVAVDQVVKREGVMHILDAIYQSTGYRPNESVLGGRERVNRDGKMTKRIKRNMRRDYDRALSDELIQNIGNIMNAHSLSARNYIVEHTDDFYGTVGRFGDSDSCFRPGGEYSSNREAMENSDCASVFRVYKESGDRLARAWVYHDRDGAIVLFNGYGIALDKIAILASKLGDLEPRPVLFNSNIYINTCHCYAIGGTAESYEVDFDIEDGNCSCENCGYECYEEDLVWTEENGNLCEDCLSELYYHCDECDEQCHGENDPGVTVYKDDRMGHAYELFICESCCNDSYTKCEGCGEFHHDDRISRTGDDANVCDNCVADDYSPCQECGDLFHNDTLTWNDDSDPYCSECYKENYSECYECGAIFHNEDLELDNSGDRYCDSCKKYGDFETLAEKEIKNEELPVL